MSERAKGKAKLPELKSAKGSRPPRGALFKLDGVGEIHLHVEHDLACARLEAVGFERVASRLGSHGTGRWGREEEPEPLDEFILWSHPSGALLSTDSYHGRMEGGDEAPVYNRNFKRFNSFHLYWQTRLGGGDRSERIESLGGSSSVKSEGDGCYRLIQGETYTQGGNDLCRLLAKLNKLPLAPLSEWVDAFVYLNPGLYLDDKRAGEKSPEGKALESSARRAFVAALPEPYLTIFTRQMGEPPKPGSRRPLPLERPSSDFNALVSECMAKAGMNYQEPEDRARLIALSLGETPAGPEGWEPIGPCGVGAAHALPFFSKESRERALAAWDALDDRLALRLANEPDARGVSPFMNCFALNRGTTGENIAAAQEFAGRMLSRFGRDLIVSNPSERVSVLTLMLSDAPPGRELAGSYPEDQARIMAEGLRRCAESGLDVWRFFPRLDPESAAAAPLWTASEPVERAGEATGVEAASAFIQESRARLGEAADGLAARVEALLLDEQLEESPRRAPRSGL